jgi:hypothetical protein
LSLPPLFPSRADPSIRACHGFGPRPAAMLRILAPLCVSLFALPAAAQIATTSTDFAQPGTQPNTLTDPVASIQACTFCHSDYAEDQEPFERWSGSMMANSMRDPVFQAAMTIANQDMAGSGEHCMRCHTPGGWVEGRATPADGSALVGQDFEGVNCNMCHRLVDPIADMANPAEDAAILAALSPAPTSAHGGQMILDPEDRRRGPFDLGPSFFWHDWLQSVYHRESLQCATCHEVSNPAFTRSGGATPAASDTYVLGSLNSQHPTHEKTDQFPVERTFTEWSLSDFASAPIEMGGRFGGNQTAVSTCQDCHMPTTTGTACQPFLEGETRTDLPQHDLNGANSWVPLAIYSLDQSLDLYPETHVNGQPLEVFEAAVERNKAMLRAASDLALSKVGNDLVVRITNQTGHKLPTGYAEGRRMWINVKFRNYAGSLVDEHGEYDGLTAELETSDTKVYEIHHGLDAAMATATGLPAGASFHFTLNNQIVKDNRIPPRGFDNAAFEAGQAQPVAASYADGQYWDDTSFSIPSGADYAVVSVFHQTTSKEYIEFLRDENTTDDKGDIVYDEWVAAGMSAPVLMDRRAFRLSPVKFSKHGKL